MAVLLHNDRKVTCRWFIMVVLVDFNMDYIQSLPSPKYLEICFSLTFRHIATETILVNKSARF